MSDVIIGILAMRIIVQFIGQAVGVMLLRKRNGTKNLPYKMPLYPLPVIIAIIIWITLFCCTGLKSIISFGIVIGTGIIVYFIQAKVNYKWPYQRVQEDDQNEGSSANSVT